MGNCSSTSNCNPCGPDFNAINQLATKAGAYARQANTYAVNAENAFLEFNALYLGAFAVAPTVDNEGDPLQTGALYWNSVINEMFVWNGTMWLPDAFNEFTPFLATGTTFARNLVTREADVINVKDFGASVTASAATNNSAIQAAINAAAVNGGTIYFPGPGTYNISTTITVPNNVKVNLASNTNVPRNLFVINGAFYRDGRSPEGDGSNFGRIFSYKTNSSETTNGNEYNFGKIDITDSVSMVGSSGSKVNGLSIVHNFGGPNSSGGRHALNGRLLHGYGGPATLGPPNPATTDRNYVGTVGQVLTDAWEGGAAGSPKGAFFGINAYAGARGNSTFIFNLTSAEFNTNIAAGDVNRVHYHSGIQISSNIGTRGTSVDAAISISNLGGSPNGWKNGILFGGQNGRQALDVDSTAIKINSPHNTTIDVTGINVPVIINHNAFVAKVNGNQDVILELGNKTVNNSNAIRFFSTSTGLPSASINSGSTGVIALACTTAVIGAPILQPQQNNVTALGTGSSRWTEVFAINGTINTSDGRNKQQVRTLSDKEKIVANKLKSLIRAYKWNDAVESKGDGARIHFGVIAQDVKTAFEEDGLNADEYGIFCYDEWDAIEDKKDFEGNIVIAGREAGNSYGVRYNELTMFILANL
jgi:hypothetical protein